MSARGKLFIFYFAAMGIATAMLIYGGLVYFSAVDAEAQTKIAPGSGGGGIVPPGSAATGEGVTGSAAPKFIEGTYFLDGHDLGVSNGALTGGWYVKESITTLITDWTYAVPGININIAQGSGQRLSAWEIGMKYGTLNLTHDEQQSYRFSICNIDALGSMGTTGTIMYSFGDSAYTTADRTPDGFGVLCVGSSEDLSNAWPTETWIGFVGNGTDTTYVPLGALGATNYFEIYAAADAGDVEFYLNGSLAATISSPARSTNADIEGISIWFQNDSVEFWSQMHVGPIWWQREFD